MFYPSYIKIILLICFGSTAKNERKLKMFLKLNDLLSDEDLKVTDSEVVEAFKSLGYKRLLFKKSGYRPVKMKGN